MLIILILLFATHPPSINPAMARGRQQKRNENLLTHEEYDELIWLEQAQAATAENNHEEDNETDSGPREGGVPVISGEPRDTSGHDVSASIHNLCDAYMLKILKDSMSMNELGY